MSIMIMLAAFLIIMWLFSGFARRQQQKMLAEQDRRREEALVAGTWVRTTGGFYGQVVDVDGDVVVLATQLGDESLWNKKAIVCAEEPPFASAGEDDATAGDAAEVIAEQGAADSEATES
ncbi:preprotein translocase subunit [Actinomyces sp. Chiba101]|uniref:Preprotein translocase subunit YajC n=1 Tax=Actinomyces denticolens TaxID=52767 RepID=A0ABY1IIK7_9ACTO|nr:MULTISPECIES: preprotein translocase subunit YajC [Actinomyces]BAW93216.1 preprotein translocase subunit [Actinomyces sp. Chiba101]GAV95548.1 preprotein translocase subunit [Actinomyces denticolens]SHJ21928.1 preprotein translocase subunit YajC [Actinomyces denticolens]SUU04320.1 preprotein translocase subunit YajC [Actinomyces denticolens]